MADKTEHQVELFDHLGELRTRLIRIFVYAVVGTAIAWFFYDFLFAVLTAPMDTALKNSKFLLTSFPEAFMMRLTISLIAGLVLTIPLISIELWGFIAPALSREERKPLWWIIPLSVILFLSGVSLCYYILPTAFSWFVSYIPPNAELRPSAQGSLLFTVKMMLAFGLMFELPVVLMLLASVGIINSKFLKSNWRVALIVVSLIAAVVTPSGDAFSMLMMAVPVTLLYFASIGLVRVIERKRK